MWRGIESYGDLERVVGAPALQNRWATVGLALVTGSWVAAETFPLRDALFYAPTFNREYSRAELEEPIRIVGGIEKEELHRQPVVCSRCPYLRWYAHTDLVALPFTDLKGLRTYLGINPSHFLFLEYTNRQFPVSQGFRRTGSTGWLPAALPQGHPGQRTAGPVPGAA